jgi:hypothetical protein
MKMISTKVKMLYLISVHYKIVKTGVMLKMATQSFLTLKKDAMEALKDLADERGMDLYTDSADGNENEARVEERIII